MGAQIVAGGLSLPEPPPHFNHCANGISIPVCSSGVDLS